MEHLDDVRIAQQVEERLEIEPLGQGIDDGLVRRRGRLDQAQLGPVGRFPHEFGVDGDERGLGQARTEFYQCVIGGDWRHSDAIAPREPVVARAATEFRPLIQAVTDE